LRKQTSYLSEYLIIFHMFYESEKGEDAIVRSPPYDFYERGCHNMKAIIKQSRLLTTIFLILGFAVYLAYVIVNKANGGRTTDDVIGWIVFDTIVFGAIIVGMWSKKAHALVSPALFCLVSINLAINSINTLSYYRWIGNPDKAQLNVWLAAINATCCFIGLLFFLLSYLVTSKAKLFRIIGILMVVEVCLGYFAAGIIDLSTGYHVDGIWDLSIFSIWLGMVFGLLYVEGDREKQAGEISK